MVFVCTLYCVMAIMYMYSVECQLYGIGKKSLCMLYFVNGVFCPQGGMIDM